MINLPRLRSAIVGLGGIAVAHNRHDPGWHWSVDVGDGADWCQTRHVGYAIQGTLEVRLENGSAFRVEAGEVFDIPPGHDGWVVGDIPYETVEWMGARNWIESAGTLGERILTNLVVTDIVESTVRARELGPRAWGDLISSYELRVRDTLASHRGREVKLTGDGVLAAFDGTARAIRCAIALRAVGDGLALRTRTVVHTGEVEVAERDLHGLAVHEAARMLGLAQAGDILVSATSRALTLDAGFRFVDRGEHELRGLVGSRRVFALV